MLQPDATNVAGFRTWTSLGRFVRRGEKGVFILAPMVGEKRNKDENAEHAKGGTPIRLHRKCARTPLSAARQQNQQLAVGPVYLLAESDIRTVPFRNYGAHPGESTLKLGQDVDKSTILSSFLITEVSPQYGKGGI